MAKKALLIGINRYRIPGADLRGCVNDVENIAEALKEYYGFSSRGIRKLTDFQATTDRMRKEISKLIGNAKKGDILYLHYSGHGSNVPDKDGDEADHRDEILCPTDLDWKDPLTDDWLREQLDRLPKGASLTVVFDCCHSGSATRAIQPPDAPIIPRYLPSPWDLVAAESGRSLRGRVRGGRSTRRRRAGRRGEVATVNLPEVLITGCRDDQTSADAFIEGDYHGACTYNLVASIKARRGKLSYRELHTDTLKRIRAGRFTQRPQLEGRNENLDAPVLEPF